jgi:hypothetical protein
MGRTTLDATPTSANWNPTETQAKLLRLREVWFVPPFNSLAAVAALGPTNVRSSRAVRVRERRWLLQQRCQSLRRAESIVRAPFLSARYTIRLVSSTSSS